MLMLSVRPVSLGNHLASKDVDYSGVHASTTKDTFCFGLEVGVWFSVL